MDIAKPKNTHSLIFHMVPQIFTSQILRLEISWQKSRCTVSLVYVVCSNCTSWEWNQEYRVVFLHIFFPSFTQKKYMQNISHRKQEREFQINCMPFIPCPLFIKDWIDYHCHVQYLYPCIYFQQNQFHFSILFVHTYVYVYFLFVLV